MTSRRPVPSRIIEPGSTLDSSRALNENVRTELVCARRSGAWRWARVIEVAQSEEEQLLRSTAVRFVDSEYPRAAVRELLGTPSGIPDGYNRQIGALGWLSLLVPESGEAGVAERGVTFSAIVAEERGRGLQPGSFIPASVVIGALCRSGSEKQRTTVLPALAAGEQVATWAVTDTAGTFAPDSALTARVEGEEVTLSGAALVQDAGLADWFLVTASGPDGPSQVLVPRSEVTSIEPRDALDVTMRFSVVRFDGVKVPATSLVGPAGGAAEDIEWQLQLAATLAAAETVGAMDALFELTRQYALDRFAFGRPIGSFQALKHQLADISMNLEAARAVTASAVEAVEAGRDDAGEVASIAKAWAGDVGAEMAQGCWQIFGGISQTWEHDSHLFLRRITMNGLLYGGAEWHRERICRIHAL
jgi:alkylation response protein AidB-like acyl-CoA dehydrogenase